ncbi:PAS domain-containing protein [Rhizobium terricola]|uniref:PAS domain-containing protein n=1 Tax=Rhizobium terricola TaxID=2728849 RepID=UPI0028F41124|nr:PAS domain-containing protein [Rhizobium terricola]
MASQVFPYPSLLPLFEAVSLKNVQLQQAIRVGDDHLVRLLDRELDPLIAAVIDYHAADLAEIHLQLRFISNLIREDADDRSCVQRHAAVLSVLLDRYFGDNTANKGRSPSSHGEVPLEARVQGEDGLLNESILNSLPDRVAVLTLDYRYLYANPAHAAYLKSTPLELVGRNLFDFLEDDQVSDGMRVQLDRCFAGEQGDYSYWSFGDGRSMPLRCRLTPLRTGRGDVIGAVMMLLDNQVASGEIAA